VIGGLWATTRDLRLRGDSTFKPGGLHISAKLAGLPRGRHPSPIAGGGQWDFLKCPSARLATSVRCRNSNQCEVRCLGQHPWEMRLRRSLSVPIFPPLVAEPTKFWKNLMILRSAGEFF